MSEQTQESGTPAEHAFSVTHFVRPAGQFGSWTQSTSPEGSAAEARAFIDTEQESAKAAGLTDPQDSQGAPQAGRSEPLEPGTSQAGDEGQEGSQEPSGTEPE
jgi:hypothetical protein